LLLGHDEYKDNILLYEILHCQDGRASMHGAAVTSIAVGKTIGVAPDANVYYIASTFGLVTPVGFTLDLEWMAKSIYRMLEINEHLPKGEKIRVISISRGFDKLGEEGKGGDKVYEAIEVAKKAGVFVITTSTEENYNVNLAGLGRGLYDDPDRTDSYTPGLFWARNYYKGRYWADQKNLLLVPMDSRSYASFTGTSDYAFGRMGGFSWTCPWLAGMYALCAQINPEITPDEFIDIALKTADFIPLTHDGKTYNFGAIINPLKIIESLEN